MNYNFLKKFHLINSQMELLKALAKGETLKQTAKNMGIKYFNLQKRTQLLYRKFNIKSRKELIDSAINKKLITTKDLSAKYRKRFTNLFIKENKIDFSSVELTKEEIDFLRLYFEGNTIQEIIIKQPLKGKYHARCINESICRKFKLHKLFQIVKYYYMFHRIYGL